MILIDSYLRADALHETALNTVDEINIDVIKHYYTIDQ